jgi:hypothetical protein
MAGPFLQKHAPTKRWAHESGSGRVAAIAHRDPISGVAPQRDLALEIIHRLEQLEGGNENRVLQQKH